MENGLYSKRMEEYSSSPAHRGAYFQEEASAKGMALVVAKDGDLKIYWLIVPEDEVVYGAKFFTYGGAESAAIGEAISLLAEGKSVDEAFGITGAAVESHLRGEADAAAEGKTGVFGRVDSIIAKARDAWPSAKALAHSTNGNGKASAKAARPELLSERAREWLALSKEEQRRRIESALDEKVRSYLQFDGGDVTLVDVVNGRDVVIEYQGACGSCASSAGATLAGMEGALRESVYDGIRVVPNTYYSWAPNEV